MLLVTNNIVSVSLGVSSSRVYTVNALLGPVVFFVFGRGGGGVKFVHFILSVSYVYGFPKKEMYCHTNTELHSLVLQQFLVNNNSHPILLPLNIFMMFFFILLLLLFYYFFFILFFFPTVYFIRPTQHITPGSGLGTGRLSKYTLKHISAV